MAKRKSPSQLVSESVLKPGPSGWFSRATPEDQEYIREVVAAMRNNPNATKRMVARNLKRELHIDRNEPAIVAVLEELLNEA